MAHDIQRIMQTLSDASSKQSDANYKRLEDGDDLTQRETIIREEAQKEFFNLIVKNFAYTFAEDWTKETGKQFTTTDAHGMMAKHTVCWI